MVPIVQKQHTQIFIVIGRSRTIDYDATKDTFPRLQSKVGVVPGGSVLYGLPCVRYGIFGSRGTLSDRNDTILVIGVVLADTVPVNTGTVLRVDEVVRYVNSDCITPVCKEGRSRNSAEPLLVHIYHTVHLDIPVDSHCGTRHTVGCDSDIVKCQPVLPGDSSVGSLCRRMSANQ